MRRVKAISSFVAIMAALSYTATAQGNDRAADMIWLKDQALREAFSDKTMDGIYKTPRQISGTNRFAETFHSDGHTDYHEGDIRDKGRWRVEGGLICFRYEGTLSGHISCFAVYKSGTCYYSYAPPEIGRDSMPRDRNRWSAKTIYRGDVSTCDDLVS